MALTSRQLRVLYVLHRACTEIRSLARAQGMDQLSELADVLEYLPAVVANDESPEVPMAEFARYQAAFPTLPGEENRRDYLKMLSEDPPVAIFRNQ